MLCCSLVYLTVEAEQATMRYYQPGSLTDKSDILIFYIDAAGLGSNR
jgi:hypothetical protein